MTFNRSTISIAAGLLLATAASLASAQRPINAPVQKGPINQLIDDAQAAISNVKNGVVEELPPVTTTTISTSHDRAIGAISDIDSRHRSDALRVDPSIEFMRQNAANTDVGSITNPTNENPTFAPDGSEGALLDAMENMDRDLDPEKVGPFGDDSDDDPLPPDVETVISQAVQGMDVKSRIAPLRYQALRQAGMTLGLRAGLARQAELNNMALEERSAALDKNYNFQGLMMQGNILPPVMAEAKDLFVQDSPDFIQLAGTNYRIVSQARFIYTPPTWRTYLMRKYPYNGGAGVVVKADSKEEKAVWEAAVREGYKRGRVQAMHILREGWQLLLRDFAGMAKYRELLAMGVVSAPYVETEGKDIVGNGENMTVGVRELRITAMPQLQTERGSWRVDVGPYSAPGYLSNRGEGLGNEVLPVRNIRDIETHRYRRPVLQPKGSGATLTPRNILTGD